uniref:AGRL2-4 GAIN subdomain A domain-containing protein n=1 Tax=Magallana gigas TaxID=29159 RepID=K1QYZ2_MAGGI
MGDEMNVQCTVTNPESLSDVTNGSLVITKDGSVLQGQMRKDGIQDTKMVQDKVNNAIQTMKNITSTNELSAGDLSSSLDILEKIVDLTNSTGSIIEKENVFYGVIDNVLSANNSKSWKTVSEKGSK